MPLRFLLPKGNKKAPEAELPELLAETVGFEPTCPVKDKTISSFYGFTVFEGTSQKIPYEAGR